MKFKKADIVREARIFLCACLVLAGGAAFAGTRFQTVDFDGIPNQVYLNNPVVLHGSSQSGLPLVYSVQTPATCHISGPDSNGVIYVASDAGGICQVLAEQMGDATWAYANATHSFFIDKATQMVGASVSGGTVPFGMTRSLSYGSNVVGMPVSIAVNTPAVCSVSGNMVTGLAGGTCSLTFTQPGDARFYPASSVLTFAVTPILQASLSLSFSYGLSMPYGLTQTVTVAGGSGTGAVTLYASNANCTLSGFTLTAAGAGSCEVYAIKAADNNYLEQNSGNQPITVTKADQPAADITGSRRLATASSS